jgi:transcription termination factor Rho
VTETQDQLSVLPSSAGNPGGATSAAQERAKRRSGSLSSLLLPELQALAGSMGLSTGKLRKSELIAAIESARQPAESAPASNGATTAPTKTARPRRAATRAAGAPQQPTLTDGAQNNAPATNAATAPGESSPTTNDSVSSDSVSNDSVSNDSASAQSTRRQARAATTQAPESEAPTRSQGERNGRSTQTRDGQTRDGQARDGQARDGQARDGQARDGQARDGQARDNQNRDNQGAQNGNRDNQNREGQARDNQNRDGQNNRNNNRNAQRDGANRNQNNNVNSSPGNDEDDDFGNRRGRRYRDRRGRTRDRNEPQGGNSRNDSEPTISDDDVLVPVAGILDNVDDKGSWFIRVSGYFATSDDVYVANSHVRRYGLRRGDAVTGAVRQPREGERKEKFNPLVRLDTVNGVEPDQLRNRVEFTKLTPLYPQERLRLETEPHILTTRVIDLVMPIGKGQRALIVSPPKAGKTMIMQSIANAIATNNPECHLMVVLVDERPEEVTDMQRSVKGEVIASTFDRRPQDHTMVAELSIERAKRLVEMGHDVVVLLDSITRLGRAYNLAAPASGRILSGGVDSTALYQPKRFLGAARNIENGGSLTIIATALVETGSAGDTLFFEEYKGTGNAELKLDRKIADKRVFPAVDVDQSSTRKEEILLSPDELAVVIKLRRVLHSLDPQQGIDLLLDRLRKTRTNIEFLMQIAKSTPGADDR